jgi:hypothetical protein
MEIKRPAGFTVLSIFLGWFALTGLLNPFVSNSTINPILALLYGITALIVAIGLWKIKPWSFKAYLTWCGFVVLTMISMQLNYAFQMTLLIFLAFACFLLILLFLIGMYIRNKLKTLIEPSN